jgi:hypothetical protein
MKQTYPNFDFPKWLEHYYLINIFLTRKDVDQSEIEDEIDKFYEMKDQFLDQEHCHLEDTWCGCCQFVSIIEKFNRFCRTVAHNPTLVDIVSQFISNRFPNYKSSADNVAKVLVNHGFSYKVVDSHKNKTTFDYSMVENIKKFLEKLEINYN